MDRKSVIEAINTALQDKGKRKFVQSVEMIVNFRGVDFSKAENRLNIDILLPKGRGKEQKVVVFADGQIALEAKNSGADRIIDAAELSKLASDKKKVKILAKGCEFIAQPNMMVSIGKTIGQVLGARGKLPRPIVGSVKDAIEQAKRRVRIASRGKYLPVSQCIIGSENMSAEDIADNFEAVYEKIKAKVTEPNIKSIYVKLSMGKPIRVQ